MNSSLMMASYPDQKQKLNNFPKVYYISLEESEDRRENLRKSFLKYGVYDLQGVISKRYSESSDQVSGPQLHILDGGTIGCVVSHIKMIKKWYEETDDEYAFFCEDDLSLETVSNWNFTWNDFVNNLPEDWDCVQLCCIKPSHDSVVLKERSMYDWSVTAYIMKRNYAKKIIDRYCFGDKFNLEIYGTDFYPMPETVLFYDIGKVYAVDLFVEEVKFQSTFTETANIEGGTKDHHAESQEFVSSWWEKNGQNITIEELVGTEQPKPKREKTELEDLLTKFSLDTENAVHNFNLGVWYENGGHTAPALSYYLRAAERSEDNNLTYEALIRGSYCYDKQGTRDNSSKSLLTQALCSVPSRPEAYFLLSRFAERRSQWMEAYTFACQGLEYSTFDHPDLITDVEYPGKYGLIYQKALSGWWWGKSEECKELFQDLMTNYEMNDHYLERSKEHIASFNLEITEKKN